MSGHQKGGGLVVVDNGLRPLLGAGGEDILVLCGFKMWDVGGVRYFGCYLGQFFSVLVAWGVMATFCPVGLGTWYIEFF